jgi:hypothetical protein
MLEFFWANVIECVEHVLEFIWANFIQCAEKDNFSGQILLNM